jgi:hypothetical protein
MRLIGTIKWLTLHFVSITFSTFVSLVLKMTRYLKLQHMMSFCLFSLVICCWNCELRRVAASSKQNCSHVQCLVGDMNTTTCECDSESKIEFSTSFWITLFPFQNHLQSLSLLYLLSSPVKYCTCALSTKMKSLRSYRKTPTDEWLQITPKYSQVPICLLCEHDSCDC